jgi:hypothetical protein
MQGVNNLFVTHCDENYLSRALCLADSLERQSPGYKLLIICHTEIALEVALNQKNSNSFAILLSELVNEFDVLQTVSANRSHSEYIFALTPFVIDFALNLNQVHNVCYVDADSFFFGNPEKIFSIPRKYDVAISPHNFIEKLECLSRFGRFNVGIVLFKNTINSRNLLKWWQERCIESTSITNPDSEVFGDQKYLDKFPSINPNTYIYPSLGINAGPWNTQNLDKKTRITLKDGEELINFHFSGLTIFGFIYIRGLERYGLYMGRELKHRVYSPYIRKLLIKELEIFGINKLHPVGMNSRRLMKSLLYLDIGVSAIALKRIYSSNNLFCFFRSHFRKQR